MGRKMNNLRSDYWSMRKDGDLIVRYNSEFNRFGWDRLKAIAQKARKFPVWGDMSRSGMASFEISKHQAEIGDLDGIRYISFPMKDPNGKVIVFIETQTGFENCLGVKLSELAEYQYVSDGQHKHGKN